MYTYTPGSMHRPLYFSIIWQITLQQLNSDKKKNNVPIHAIFNGQHSHTPGGPLKRQHYSAAINHAGKRVR